jgi:hypothetical protein
VRSTILPEAQIEALEPLGVLVQQEAEIGGGFMCCGDRQEHDHSYAGLCHCYKSISPVIFANSIFIDVEPAFILIVKRVDDRGEFSESRLGSKTFHSVFCCPSRFIDSDHLYALTAIFVNMHMLNDMNGHCCILHSDSP